MTIIHAPISNKFLLDVPTVQGICNTTNDNNS